MSILSGFFKTKKLRRMADGNYKLQSEWTSSETVEMADGNTAEENLGSIKGITSSLASTDSGYALAADAGKNLQDQVNELNSNLQDKADTSTVTSLQTSVNTINTNLAIGTLFKDERTTASLTLAGGETKSINIKPKNVNGYVPITIMGVAVANVFLTINEFYLNTINGRAIVCLYNRNSTSQTASITLTVLYAKSI